MAQRPTVRNEAIKPEDEQPTRRGARETTRTFDQTFLDPDSGVIHRDYLAHALRWGFSKRQFIQHDVSRVLDVGCGPDKPLFMILFGGIGGGDGGFPKEYTAVDLNRVKPTRHQRSQVYSETNFFEAWKTILKERGPFDLITNFEVIEHMPVDKGLELLTIFRKCLAPGGKVLLSTPVYDGIARAKNHIHEYTIDELAQHFKKAKLEVIQRYGTFANVNAIKKVMTAEQRVVFDQLKTWYGNDIMSCLMAPLYPDASRNNYWVAKRTGDV